MYIQRYEFVLNNFNAGLPLIIIRRSRPGRRSNLEFLSQPDLGSNMYLEAANLSFQFPRLPRKGGRRLMPFWIGLIQRTGSKIPFVLSNCIVTIA